MQTSWLLIQRCCFGLENHLHNYVSFIRIPVHYLQYHIMHTVHEHSLSWYTPALNTEATLTPSISSPMTLSTAVCLAQVNPWEEGQWINENLCSLRPTRKYGKNKQKHWIRYAFSPELSEKLYETSLQHRNSVSGRWHSPSLLQEHKYCSTIARIWICWTYTSYTSSSIQLSLFIWHRTIPVGKQLKHFLTLFFPLWRRWHGATKAHVALVEGGGSAGRLKAFYRLQGRNAFVHGNSC